MKKIFTILITVLSVSAFSQTLKTFNGTFNDGKLQNGNAVYTYYEDPNTHEYLKQGVFKYTFNGKGDYQGYDQTITGSFEKGLKNGTWTYTITMADFGNNNPYYTGTVSLVANYKNGYADGNWKEVRSYKTRKKYLQYGKYTWDAFGPVKTMTINMNFKNGYLAGAVSINDEFANFKATGTYDNNSLCTGTWIINDMGWGKNRELIYKDNFLYEFIARSNSGAVEEGTTKYQSNYDNYLKAKLMTVKDREEAGFSIDTVCGGTSCAATNNIQEYFPKLFSVDYFLYEFIGGDLSFKEGFKGGCDIHVTSTNFTPLSSNVDFKSAEELYSKKDYLSAYITYSKIDINNVKPSERSVLKNKLASINIDSLVAIYTTNTEFFPKYFTALRDSIESDSKLVLSSFKLNIVLDDYGNKKIVDENGIQKSFNEYSRGNKYNCECPWSNYNFETAKLCFDMNKGVFMPSVIAYSEYYYKMKDVMNSEEKNTTKKYYLGSSNGIPTALYNKLNGQFNTYDKTTLINNVQLVKKEYDKAKLLVVKETKMIEKKNQIETLNKQNKKKILYSKFIVVYTDIYTKYQAFNGIQNGNDLLTEINSIADKVILLWTQDTKEIEKQLKDAETSEQIKTIILGK